MQLKGKILNPRLASTIVGLGHRDRIVVSDAGLPLPTTVPVLDLSVVPDLPSLEDVLTAVLDELEVEAAYVAEEFAPESPDVYRPVAALLDGVENPERAPRGARADPAHREADCSDGGMLALC